MRPLEFGMLTYVNEMVNGIGREGTEGSDEESGQELERIHRMEVPTYKLPQPKTFNKSMHQSLTAASHTLDDNPCYTIANGENQPVEHTIPENGTLIHVYSTPDVENEQYIREYSENGKIIHVCSTPEVKNEYIQENSENGKVIHLYSTPEPKSEEYIQGYSAAELFSSGYGLAYDDFLVLPLPTGEVPVEDVDLSTHLTRDIVLSVPLASAPADSVTESEMAIHMALLGGVGFIHCHCSPKYQAEEVRKVKAYKLPPPSNSHSPVTPRKTLGPLLSPASGFTDTGPSLPIRPNRSLTEFLAHGTFPRASRDKNGRLLVGTALDLQEDITSRLDDIVSAGADVILLEGFGPSMYLQVDAIKRIKHSHPHVQVIGGNVTTEAQVMQLICAGVDAVRVGPGRGTCYVREVPLGGRNQGTAVYRVSHFCRKFGVPVIAEGCRGMVSINGALSLGTSVAVMDAILAGTSEAPHITTTPEPLPTDSIDMLRVVALSPRLRKNAAGRVAKTSVLADAGSVLDLVPFLLEGLRQQLADTGVTSIPHLHGHTHGDTLRFERRPPSSTYNISSASLLPGGTRPMEIL